MFVNFFNQTECGLRFSEPNVRIIGGEETVPYSWPAIAFIYIVYNDPYPSVHSRALFCSGTLINRDTVLTAGHCVLDASFTEFPLVLGKRNPTYESMYTVFLGAHDLTSLELNTVFDEYYYNDDLARNGSKPLRVKVKKLIKV